MTKCRCLMADDHPVVRRGVRDLLEAEGLCSKVHEVGSGQDALEAIRQAPWDLLILDVALPDVHGLEVLKEAKRIQPSLPVLMLSLYPEKEFALRAIKSGASGYLTKESAPSALVVAVRQILKKGRYITASLADGVRIWRNGFVACVPLRSRNAGAQIARQGETRLRDRSGPASQCQDRQYLPGTDTRKTVLPEYGRTHSLCT